MSFYFENLFIKENEHVFWIFVIVIIAIIAFTIYAVRKETK